jgi:uncharacterized BrkB/YihY/UPF0761 family membrane protein
MPPKTGLPAPTREGREVGRVESVRLRAGEIQSRLVAARGRHTSVDASFHLIERDRRIAASVLAGGIAFRLFLWLLPLSLILGGALGFTSNGEEIAHDAGLTAAAADAVGEAVDDAGEGRWALLVIGVGALLWTSTWSVVALRRVYALVWNVPPPRSRNPLIQALAFSGVCSILLLIPAGSAWLRDLLGRPGIIIPLLAVGAFFGVWLWVSDWLPHGDAPLRALVPGALLAAVGMQAIHLFTAFYVAVKLERASALYGGLGLAATFLFILYIVGRLIVASALVNEELWRRSRELAAAGHGSPG